MNINIGELRKLIREVKQNRLNEYGETNAEQTREHHPHNVAGTPVPEQDYREVPDGQLTDEEKARSFEDMFRDIKLILEKWKERDPNTVAGKYFHDLLHLAKAYDPSYFPATDAESAAELPPTDKEDSLTRPY
jgi:hypothetical protein